MSRMIQKGAVNQSIEIYIIDSTDGTPETGVLFNTAGMDLKYRRELSAVVSITEATLASLTTAHADGGFLEIGNGLYRLDLPDAAVASGADQVAVFGTVTGMIVLPTTIQLVDYNPMDAVRLGLTAIPNANADAAGGLPISDAGGLDFDTKLANTNEVTAARMGALTDWINGGRLDLILDIIAADVLNIDGAAMRGTDNAALASVLGALADAAAAGDPTSADTVMAYLKQIINTVEGTTGIPVYPTSADPANNVSLAEAIRAIRDDVTGIAGAAMRGTDSALLASSAPTNFSSLSISVGGLVDILQTAADKIWSSTTRTLSAFSTALSVSVWNVLESAISTASSIGLKLKNNLDAAITTRTAPANSQNINMAQTTPGSPTADTVGEALRKAHQQLPEAPEQNQAFNNIEFLMVDSTDFATPETGLTVSGQRSIDGGAFAAVAGTIAEVGNGIYQFDATAADMNGATITFRFTATGAADTFLTIKTTPAP